MSWAQQLFVSTIQNAVCVSAPDYYMLLNSFLIDILVISLLMTLIIIIIIRFFFFLFLLISTVNGSVSSPGSASVSSASSTSLVFSHQPSAAPVVEERYAAVSRNATDKQQQPLQATTNHVVIFFLVAGVGSIPFCCRIHDGLPIAPAGTFFFTVFCVFRVIILLSSAVAAHPIFVSVAADAEGLRDDTHKRERDFHSRFKEIAASQFSSSSSAPPSFESLNSALVQQGLAFETSV